MLRDVPALGGFINSYDWFAEGDIGRGVFYLGMGISDAFAVKALATSTGKFIIRQASKQIAKNIDNVVANTLTRSEMAIIKGAGDTVNVSSFADDLVRVRHHTSYKYLKEIKKSKSILSSRGKPYGVDVEVAPFLNPKNVSLGQSNLGSYVEFSVRRSLLITPPGYLGGTGNAGRIVTGLPPLDISGLSPRFVRWNWLGF